MKSIAQLASENNKRLHELEALLGHGFSDITLLQLALIHSSFGFEQLYDGRNNETLEFLGDAVLDLAVSDMLFHRYPGIREGELTKMRAHLVREATLAEMARSIMLGNFLLLGKGETASRGSDKDSILASTFEALVGAMYLDRGYEAVLRFINAHFKPMLHDRMEEMLVEDAKSILQEKLQDRFSQAPVYNLDAEEGPDHDKRFTFSVSFMDEILGTGIGSSKKAAERQAAEQALASLDSWWERLPQNK